MGMMAIFHSVGTYVVIFFKGVVQHFLLQLELLLLIRHVLFCFSLTSYIAQHATPETSRYSRDLKCGCPGLPPDPIHSKGSWWRSVVYCQKTGWQVEEIQENSKYTQGRSINEMKMKED